MLIRSASVLLAALMGCASGPKVYPAEIHISLAFLVTRSEEFASGQPIATYGHLYDGWLYLSEESAEARDIMSALPVGNPYDDRDFRDSPCDAQFVRVFGVLSSLNGEWRIRDVRRIEIPSRTYPRGATGDWSDWAPEICFELGAPPAV